MFKNGSIKYTLYFSKIINTTIHFTLDSAGENGWSIAPPTMKTTEPLKKQSSVRNWQQQRLQGNQ